MDKEVKIYIFKKIGKELKSKGKINLVDELKLLKDQR